MTGLASRDPCPGRWSTRCRGSRRWSGSAGWWQGRSGGSECYRYRGAAGRSFFL